MTVKERKFAIVGDRGVGKTTVLKATNSEVVDTKQPTVYYKFLSRVSKKKKKDKGKVLVSFWDIPEDECSSEARLAIYKKMDAVLIVFSVDRPESLERARKRWYPELRKHCRRKIPVILVGNKVDLRNSDSDTTVSFSQGLKVAEKIKAYAYVECSALSNHHTLDVFQFAIRPIMSTGKPKKQ